MGLMRRIYPKHTDSALSALLTLLPQHSSDLLSQVDQPLQASPIELLGRQVYIEERRACSNGGSHGGDDGMCVNDKIDGSFAEDVHISNAIGGHPVGAILACAISEGAYSSLDSPVSIPEPSPLLNFKVMLKLLYELGICRLVSPRWPPTLKRLWDSTYIMLYPLCRSYPEVGGIHIPGVAGPITSVDFSLETS